MISNESLHQLEDEIRETILSITEDVSRYFAIQMAALYLSLKAMSHTLPYNSIMLLSIAIMWMKGVSAISTIYTGVNRCRELLNRAKQDKKDGAAADGGATLARNEKKTSIVLWFVMVFVLAFAFVVFVMLITMAMGLDRNLYRPRSCYEPCF